MLRRTLLATVPAAAASVALAGGPRAAAAVDLLLVLAIDASGSITDTQIGVQREGHARALEAPRFLGAVAGGPLGRIALTVVEWSSRDAQTQTVPWTMVEDAASARRVADAMMRAARPIPGYTSISGAIDFAARLIDQAPFEATRRVIDIAGNGTNNDGRPACDARDDAMAVGITVNGLPILDEVPDLDAYFTDQVIGGTRAFTVVADGLGSFVEAVQRKMVLEIAAAPSDPFRSGRPFS
jgi:hypothetical protein